MKFKARLRLADVARVCHEVNAAFCRSIGDDSQPSWDNAPEWQVLSCANGIKAVCENPDMTPEQSHEGWLEEKRADGWKWGTVKDVEQKEHPCFVPYPELSEQQRTKDALFVAVVKSLID
jgi:hypothetical protein